MISIYVLAERIVDGWSCVKGNLWCWVILEGHEGMLRDLLEGEWAAGVLSSELALVLRDLGGGLLGPDAADCVIYLLLEAGDQLAVGVDKGLLGLDLGDDGLLGFEGWEGYFSPE